MRAQRANVATDWPVQPNPPTKGQPHPDGVQLAHGPRVPQIMFGGRVRAGIDSR